MCSGSTGGSISQRYGSGSRSGSFHHQAKHVRKNLIPTAVFPLSLSFNFCVVTSLVLAPHPGLHSDGKYLIMLMLCSSVPDPPDPHVFWASRKIHLSKVWIRILPLSSKKCKKNLDSYCGLPSLPLLQLLCGHPPRPRPHPGLHSDGKYLIMLMLCSSVPDPPDPHVFGPPGSGSISQWIQIGLLIRILPLSSEKM